MQYFGFQWQCKVQGQGIVPTVRFNNSLERLIDLTESFILMVTVYCRVRVQFKISHEKRSTGWSSGMLQIRSLQYYKYVTPLSSFLLARFLKRNPMWSLSLFLYRQGVPHPPWNLFKIFSMSLISCSSNMIYVGAMLLPHVCSFMITVFLQQQSREFSSCALVYVGTHTIIHTYHTMSRNSKSEK